MSILGSLKTIPFPELLSLLQQTRRTGVLRVVSGTEERTFLLQDGSILFATTKDPERRLGSYLVRLGILEERALALGIDDSCTDEVYFGRRLVEAGTITPDQLYQAVKYQVLDTVEEVMTWDIAAFYFDEDEVPFAIPDGKHVSTQSVLLEATRKSDERRLLKEYFPDMQAVLAKTRGAGPIPGHPDATELLERVDGKRTVDHILFATPLGLERTASLLHELIVKGYIHQLPKAVAQGDDRFVPELHSLPIAPDVPGKVFGAFLHEGGEISRVSEILSADPVLAAKALRALTLQRGDLSRASLGVEQVASLLGTFQLRSILVPEAVRGLLFPRAGCFWKEWWDHSQTVARISREVAVVTGYTFPEEAYLAGLLHNLGAFVFLAAQPAEYRAVVNDAQVRQRDLQEWEERAFGLSHAKAGALCGERWGFPKEIVNVLRSHHGVLPGDTSPLLNIVSVANGVAATYGLGPDCQRNMDEQFEASLRALDLLRRKALSLYSRSGPAEAGPTARPRARETTHAGDRR